MEKVVKLIKDEMHKLTVAMAILDSKGYHDSFLICNQQWNALNRLLNEAEKYRKRTK